MIMSAKNGDKARFHRARKRRINRRAAVRLSKTAKAEAAALPKKSPAV
jgi:hypothetical protein